MTSWVLCLLPKQISTSMWIVALPNVEIACLLCISWRIPGLSLIQHSLYIGVVEKSPPPPLTGEQYGKMEPKYPEGGDCQSMLRPQGTSSLIFNNSMLLTENLISGKVLTSCWDLTCDPWH